MVASKVHIQSGPFSFYFEHKPGDNGMGMITPIWESTDAILTDPLTRITLTLLDSLDLNDLLSQFDDFPKTLLLFLKKLSRIIIDEDVERVEDEEEGSEEGEEEDEGKQETDPGNRMKCITTLSCNLDQNIGRAQVTESVDQAEEVVAYSEEYRITRKMISNLPADGQRDYNTAEVVLAFPVFDIEGDDWPHITSQKTYAFLPIRDFGYPVSVTEEILNSSLIKD